MGPGYEISPAMSSKVNVSSQETSNIPSRLEKTSMPAYYGAGATQPRIFTSTVASPTPYRYQWGNQHSVILPYGSPLSYSTTVYPQGGLYAHPNAGASFSSTNAEEIAVDRKDFMPLKTPKLIPLIPGKADLIGGKSGQIRKTALDSGFDAISQSSGTGSRGSSDASDDDDANQMASSAFGKKSFSQILADVSASGNLATSIPKSNLNKGMSLGNTFSAGAATSRPTLSSTSQVPSGTMFGHEVILHDDHRIQADERELKRQRRKQSNRESARRSKMRKQVECDELQAKVEKMREENHTLADELNQLARQCETLNSENNNILEDLAQAQRGGVMSHIPVSHFANGGGRYTSTESNSNFASSQVGNLLKSNGNFTS